MPPILATYTTRCGACDELIVEDMDEIVEEDGEWIHRECADESFEVFLGDDEDV